MARKPKNPKNPAKRGSVHKRTVLSHIQDEQNIKDITNVHEHLLQRISSARDGLRNGSPPGRVG